MIRIIGSRVPSADSTDALGCGDVTAAAASIGCAEGVSGLGISKTTGPGADKEDADDVAEGADAATVGTEGTAAARSVAVGGFTGSPAAGNPPGGTRFVSNLYPCLYVCGGVG